MNSKPISVFEFDCPLCGVPVVRTVFADFRRKVEPVYPADPLMPGERRCAHPYASELRAVKPARRGLSRARAHTR